MQPIITAHVHDVDHPAGRGRFLSTESQYLTSLLWDPFILSRTEAVPRIRLVGEAVADPANALLLYAHPTIASATSPAQDEEALQSVLREGGRAVLNHPPDELFRRLSQLKPFGPSPVRLMSLRERWHLGPTASRSYFYADREPFLRLSRSQGETLSWIGDNPDLIVVDGIALFAGDPMTTLMSYINVPFYGQLLLDLASLLAHVVSVLSGTRLSDQERKGLLSHAELRRDFHAFGFAHLTVLELCRCQGRSRVDLAEAESRALSAARSAVAGHAHEAEALLATAFESLAAENRKLQPIPAVFTDTLHGGGLFPDLGYFEFDWPQHAADVLKTHLHWANTRSYRFNVDFGAESVANLAARFPRLMEALREAQDAGLVEFVNGTMNQPYPPFHTLESQIRQYDYGHAIFRDVLGRPPAIYASQEFGFCPQLAAILSQQGYEGVVLRVQNMGDAPTVAEERILWVAPNGDRIQTIPSHPYKTEQHNEVTYNNLHLKLFAHQQTGLDFAVFSGLGDITYYRPFREELARIAHYAPVFGRFETWSRCFRNESGQRGGVERRFTMEDFDCRAGFLELALWSVHRSATGNYNSHCVRSMAATDLFCAAEMLESVVAAVGQLPRRVGPAQEARWRALTVYQGHDTYIVPYHTAGGFMGGVSNARAAAAGRAAQNVVDYCGPWDFRPVLTRSEQDLTASEREARQSIRRHLRRLVNLPGDRDGYVVYSFAPGRRRVVRVRGAAGKTLTLAGNPVETQREGRDLLTLISLPAYGYAVLEEAGPFDTAQAPGSGHAWAGDDFLENSLVRVEFNMERGTLARLLRKADGKELLAEGGHTFTLPGSQDQRCIRSTTVAAGPLRACLELEIAVGMGRGGTCRILSRVSLDADQPLVRFEHRVLRCPTIRGDQWENHLGVRFLVSGQQVSWWRAHFNVLEAAREERVSSPNLLLARTEGGDVLFVNIGNEFYLCRGSEVSNVLIMENEPARAFEYAIGLADGNPVVQARRWTQPCFVERAARGGTSPDHPAPLPLPAASFFSVDSDDVEITSCRYQDGCFLLRLANGSNRPTRIALATLFGIEEAIGTDLRGRNPVPLQMPRGQVSLDLRPWDLRQVLLRLSPR